MCSLKEPNKIFISVPASEVAGKQEAPLIDFSTPTQAPSVKAQVKEKIIQANSRPRSRLMEMSESDSTSEEASIAVSLKSTPRTNPTTQVKNQLPRIRDELFGISCTSHV